MRIAHFSDTHLGHMRYRKVVPETGVNQREQDVYDAFERVVDAILADDPDLVVHTGDLFDTPRPANRALYHAARQLRRFVDRGIPFVLISGNHSTPRLRSTGSIFALLKEFFPAIFPAYSSEYECFLVSGVAFHCIPHCFSQEELEAQLQRVRPDSRARYNIAVLHTALRGFREFRMVESNELFLREDQLPTGMDCVLLGHYHKHVVLSPGVWYAGSSERFSFAEAEQTKGYCLFDPAEATPLFREIPVRPMRVLEPVDATGLDADDLLRAVAERIKQQSLQEAIVRLPLRNVAPAARSNLDLRAIRDLAAGALHFAIHWEGEGVVEGDTDPSQTGFRPLEEEWQSFMSKADVHGRDRAMLTRAGLDYLTSATGEGEPDAADLFGG